MMVWRGSQKSKRKSEKKDGASVSLVPRTSYTTQAQTRLHKLQTCASSSFRQSVRLRRKTGTSETSASFSFFPTPGQSTGPRTRYPSGDLPVSIFFTFAFSLFTIFFSACEESFQPTQENERYFFSINGVLDASADTHWVRVMPVRESLILESGLEAPEVTLRHVQSGQRVAMRDSVFQYSGGRYAFNFWTTMPIQPEQTYSLTVEDKQGRISTAEATLPKDFPLPRFSTHEFELDILLVSDVEKLADAQVIYRIKNDRTGGVFENAFPYLQSNTFTPPSQYRIAIDPNATEATIRETYCGITVIERNLFVASGGPDWPDFISLDRHAIALPDGVSNVENGVGFFGGIVSKTFPYINALGEDGLFRVLCP